MPLFPPATPVTIVVNGHPLASYVRPYVADGRVFAPVDPVLTGLADRLWYDGNVLVIERGARRIGVRLAAAYIGELDTDYVAVGPALRTLGAVVSWEERTHELRVRVAPQAGVATPTPFDAALPSVPPNEVFTPAPPQTPRPLWTGSPLPRRTPLRFPPPA